MIDTAMILAAGKGTRMRAAPSDPPKPLTEIAGQSLLARMMARLEAVNIRRVIINMHHKAEAIAAFAADYDGAADIILSDERDTLLETGGGVKKALRFFGDAPFLVANGDVLWRDQKNEEANKKENVLARFIASYQAVADRDDKTAHLLLAAVEKTSGYDGTGDFHLLADGRLRRKTEAAAPYVFAGVQILTPRMFDDMPSGAFSLNKIYDAAQAENRLFGHVMDGVWMHVGTPEGRASAEDLLR